MLLCPNCKENNRESARFCKKCGIWLSPRCPHCQADIPDASIYCDQCGKPLNPALHTVPAEAPALAEPVASARQTQIVSLLPESLAEKMDVASRNWALEGERRIVTILFCDLAGSTAAAGNLDPEQWAQIVNRAFEHMIRPIYAYEGTVARLMGDGILAFFGAPVAHEDDPERSVRAALEITGRFEDFRESIQAEWGIEVNIRVGINTGLVLVGQVGSDLQMEYTALGDAINLAARMEQTAAPGSVQIAEDTRRYVVDLFELEDLGLQQVKGRERPVRTYRLVREKPRPIRLSGVFGQSAPLIGRSAEWAQLLEAADANRKGVGRVLFLTGEAGIGKSRLIRELYEACARANQEAGGPEVTWYATTSTSYETSTPYAMFQRLFRRMAGADPAEPAETTWEKLRWFEDYLPEDLQVRLRQVFASLLNLPLAEGIPPLQGEAFSGQLIGVVSELFGNLADRSPVILVFDDLHWIDPASAELLEQLVSLTASHPLLVLCAIRPERATTGWKLKHTISDVHAHRFSDIVLKPLSDEESSHLIDQLLSIRRFPDMLRKQILTRADGNPLFVEEVLRTLIENGKIEIREDQTIWTGQDEETFEIPENIQALLTARIDQLPEDSRHVLQLAALIGRTFYFRVLEALFQEKPEIPLQRELERLQQAEFIREHTRRPELEYAFHHMLTQEAAYHTILHRNRRRYHLLVGRAIEELFGDQLEDQAARLVHHFQEGGDSVRCFHYSLLAGDAALRLFARTEALRNYERARELLQSGRIDREQVSAEDLLRLYKQRGRAFELASRFAEALGNYEELEQIARERGDRSLELSALVMHGTARSIVSNQFDETKAFELNRAALELAEALGDQAAEARIHWNMMIVYRNISQAQKALQAGEKSLALAESLGLREQIAYSSNDLSYVYLANGKMDRAVEVTEQAARLWEEMGNLPMLADSLSAQAGFRMTTGDLDAAFEASDRAYALSRQTRNFWGQSHSRYMLGFGHWMRGDLSTAYEMMTEAGQNADLSGFIIGQIWSRCIKACLLLELRLYEDALDALCVAEEKSTQITGYLPFIAAMKAFIAIRLDGADIEIPPYSYREGNTVSIFSASFIEQKRAQVSLERGQPAEACRILERLSALENEMNLVTNHMTTSYLLSRAYRRNRQNDQADRSFSRAMDTAERLNARWVRWQLDADRYELEEADGHAESARQDADWILAHTEPEFRQNVLDLLEERGYPFPPVVQAPE